MKEFGPYRFEPGPSTGAPLLADAPAWFEARVTDSVERGDHTVFVAEVVNAGVRDAAARPLLLSDTPWNYGGRPPLPPKEGRGEDAPIARADPSLRSG